MNHAGTMILETKQLRLRPFRMEDATAMYQNWATDEDVTKYLSWAPHESIEVTNTILQEWVNKYASKDFYQWAITFKDEDEVIGCMGVVNQNEAINEVEIGYCITKKYWRKGITTEALQIVISYLFEDIDANRIVAKHDINNPSSGSVMIKCGMCYEGTLRQADANNQGLCDCAVYSILHKDYDKRY